MRTTLRIPAALACSLLLSLPALAQRSDRPASDSPRSGPARQADRLGWMIRILAERLDLDPDQQAQYDQIVEEFRQQMLADDQPGPRELFQQMRQAREAGDRERIAELRQRLAELREQMQQQLEPFFDEVEQILRDDQVPVLNEFRERIEQRVRGPRQFAALQRAMRELRGQLDLSPEQAQKYQELTARIEEQMQSAHQHGPQMRELFEQLREARAAGDEQRVAELREQLRSLRPDPQAWLDQFFSGLEQFLTPEQLATVRQYRDKLQPQRDAGPSDVRFVLRAARRLRLDPDQRQRLRTIERDAQSALRQLRRRDREGRALLAEKVADQIREILTPQQAERFDKLLQGSRKRHRQRHGEGRDDRP